jgi:hypothetical protein
MAMQTVEDFRAGLRLGVGSGAGTVYYSRLSEIPEKDAVVSIAAKFVAGTPDKLQITLTPLVPFLAEGKAAAAATTGPATAPVAATAPAVGNAKVERPARRRVVEPPIDPRELQFPAYPAVYLLVENVGVPVRLNFSSEQQNQRMAGSVRFNAPIQMEAELPAQWNARLNFSGKARMSVIVAAEPVRPGLQQPYGYVAPVEAARGREVVGRRWVGILKSGAMEVELKKP